MKRLWGNASINWLVPLLPTFLLLPNNCILHRTATPKWTRIPKKTRRSPQIFCFSPQFQETSKKKSRNDINDSIEDNSVQQYISEVTTFFPFFKIASLSLHQAIEWWDRDDYKWRIWHLPYKRLHLFTEYMSPVRYHQRDVLLEADVDTFISSIRFEQIWKDFRAANEPIRMYPSNTGHVWWDHSALSELFDCHFFPFWNSKNDPKNTFFERIHQFAHQKTDETGWKKAFSAVFLGFRDAFGVATQLWTSSLVRDT